MRLDFLGHSVLVSYIRLDLHLLVLVIEYLSPNYRLCSMFSFPPRLALFCSLTQAAPCPAPWVVHTVYSEGDQVTSYDHLSVQNQIYKCNPWPNDGYCGQAGFQPGQNEIGTATPAWTMAWTLVGPCSESPVSDM